MSNRFKCPCCGHLTLFKKPPGTFEICPVCFWEDDNTQYNNPEYKDGANKVSLNQARKNFVEFAASERDFIYFVRKPLPEESLDKK